MRIDQLLTGCDKPLFIVGQEKNSGKTVTLNRLRAEAGLAGLSDFGLCSIGFDGEDRDHLTGGPKPNVEAYENDLIVTCAKMLPAMEAKLEIIWSDSYAGSLGRLVLGRVKRPGKVLLVGPRSVKQLKKLILFMKQNGAKHILIDGAADRQTQVAAFKGSQVCLVFRPKLKESISQIVQRIKEKVYLYSLPLHEKRPEIDLSGDQILLVSDKEFSVLNSEELQGFSADTTIETAYVAGPLNSEIAQALTLLQVETIVVKNPSDIFVDTKVIQKFQRKGSSLEYLDKPELAVVALRAEGGSMRSVSPEKLLQRLQAELPGVPCFDPLYSVQEIGGRL